MFDRLLPLVTFFYLVSPLFSEDAITVDRVKFNTLGERWVQVEIELTCNGNTAPDAVDADYLENITVKPLLAYRTGSGNTNFTPRRLKL